MSTSDQQIPTRRLAEVRYPMNDFGFIIQAVSP